MLVCVLACVYGLPCTRVCALACVYDRTPSLMPVCSLSLRVAAAEGPELDAARDEYYLDSIGRDDVATLAGVSGALEKIGLLRRAR